MKDNDIPELKFAWADLDTRCYESDGVKVTLNNGKEVIGYFRRMEEFKPVELVFVINDGEDEGKELEIEQITNYTLLY